MLIRSITRGLIDGGLSTLGIVLGASISGDPKIVAAAGIGGGMANAMSNLLGALTAERAGVMKELCKYEKAMVGSKIKLKDTKIYDQEKKLIWKRGLSDSASTFTGAFFPLTPFFLLPFEQAIFGAIFMTLSLLFVLGIYLGRLSKENILLSGIKMVLFGGCVALLAMSLEFLFK